MCSCAFFVTHTLVGFIRAKFALNPPGEFLLRSEAVSIFAGGNERLDHFRVHEIAVELVKLTQPEVVAGVVRILWVVRVARK